MSVPAGLQAIAALNGGKGPTPAEAAYLQSVHQVNSMAPATSTANAVGQDAYTYVEQNFPTLAWMLSVPELAGVLNSIAQQGITDTNQIQALVENTGWWKQNSGDLRTWYQESITDPASAQEQVQAASQSIQATADQLGVRLTQGQITSLAYADSMNGWSSQELTNHITAGIQANGDGTFSYQPYTVDPTTHKAIDTTTGRQAYLGPQGQPATPDEQSAVRTWGAGGYETGTFNGQTVYYQKNPPGFPTAANGGGLGAGANPTAEPGGTLQATQQQLQQIMSQYMVNLSAQTLAQWSQQIAAGQQTVQGFTSEMQNQALSKYPFMATAIKNGQTPYQYTDSARQELSAALGVNPQTIDFNQPMWGSLLSTTNAQGVPVANTTWDMLQRVMTNSTYGYQNSKNANDRVAAFVGDLGTTFGKTTGGDQNLGNVAPVGM